MSTSYTLFYACIPLAYLHSYPQALGVIHVCLSRMGALSDLALYFEGLGPARQAQTTRNSLVVNLVSKSARC